MATDPNEAGRGLEDPRIIHPSPDGVFPEPGASPEIEHEPEPLPAEAEVKPEVGNPGMVDPRPIGSDI